VKGRSREHVRKINVEKKVPGWPLRTLLLPIVSWPLVCSEHLLHMLLTVSKDQ
jgi:hypothetical protein